MKLIHKCSTIGLMLLLSVLSLNCDRPACTNENPAFEQLSYSSEAYKAALVKQLQLANHEDLRFWFDAYDERKGEPLLIISVQGPDFCAKMILEANNWKNLEEVINKKGVSYRNAEFRGLSFEIQKNERTAFIYKDIERIVD